MLNQISFYLMIIGGILFIGYLLVYHYQLLLRILARMIGGLCSIIIINYLLLAVEIKSGVGINIYTLLATGFLGFPGLLSLYITSGFFALFY